MKWKVDEIENWLNAKSIKWQIDEMPSWWNIGDEKENSPDRNLMK